MNNDPTLNPEGEPATPEEVSEAMFDAMDTFDTAYIEDEKGEGVDFGLDAAQLQNTVLEGQYDSVHASYAYMEEPTRGEGGTEADLLGGEGSAAPVLNLVFTRQPKFEGDLPLTKNILLQSSAGGEVTSVVDTRYMAPRAASIEERLEKGPGAQFDQQDFDAAEDYADEQVGPVADMDAVEDLPDASVQDVRLVHDACQIFRDTYPMLGQPIEEE